MKHRWLLVIGCAWITWEADVDPKTTLDKRLSSVDAFESKAECEKAALRQAKMVGIAIETLRSKELVFHQVLGNVVEAHYKNGTHEATRWECWPSDFDPTKSIPKIK